MHFETSTYFNSDLKISLQNLITSEDKISEECDIITGLLMFCFKSIIQSLRIKNSHDALFTLHQVTMQKVRSHWENTTLSPMTEEEES